MQDNPNYPASVWQLYYSRGQRAWIYHTLATATSIEAVLYGARFILREWFASKDRLYTTDLSSFEELIASATQYFINVETITMGVCLCGHLLYPRSIPLDGWNTWLPLFAVISVYIAALLVACGIEILLPDPTSE